MPAPSSGKLKPVMAWAAWGAAFGFLVGLGVAWKHDFDGAAVTVYWPVMTLGSALVFGLTHWPWGDP